VFSAEAGVGGHPHADRLPEAEGAGTGAALSGREVSRSPRREAAACVGDGSGFEAAGAAGTAAATAAFPWSTGDEARDQWLSANCPTDLLAKFAEIARPDRHQIVGRVRQKADNGELTDVTRYLAGCVHQSLRQRREMMSPGGGTRGSSAADAGPTSPGRLHTGDGQRHTHTGGFQGSAGCSPAPRAAAGEGPFARPLPGLPLAAAPAAPPQVVV